MNFGLDYEGQYIMKGDTGHTYMNRHGIKHLSLICSTNYNNVNIIKMNDFHSFPSYLYQKIYVFSL